jgi:toxin ParE1/3/4
MSHRLAPEAEADLDDIWLYTATESGSLEIADRLIDSITERFFLLSRHPHVGRERDADLRAGLRSFPVSRYIILYRVTDENEVLILHVFPAARDVEPLLHHLAPQDVKPTASATRRRKPRKGK